MSKQPQVALLVPPGEEPQPFIAAIEHGEGQAVLIELSDDLPENTGGLLVAGNGAFDQAEKVPQALTQAIENGSPVLGIGWGMHALNVALGGLRPVRVEGHGNPTHAPTSTRCSWLRVAKSATPSPDPDGSPFRPPTRTVFYQLM